MDEYPFNILDIANILRLTVRRELADSVYVDCPFCNKHRKGKLNLNLVKNVWRCNRCGESGHMFELYARLRGILVSDAKLELIDLLAESVGQPCVSHSEVAVKAIPAGRYNHAVEQSPKASREEIDRTMRAMLEMLSVRPEHREHLHHVRGLNDDQIDYLGLKSTPSFKLRHVIPRRLQERGCTLAGVPGFFVDRYGKWTVNFTTWTAGILIPTRDMDGLISGAQIRLDKPIKDDESDPEEQGTKYIWFSSSNKSKGTSSGCPVNLIGNRYAHTVYITEGAFKAGIAHCLMKRTVLSIQGANNLNGVKEAFLTLKDHGTQLIVEALDIDKFNNVAVAKGAQKIYLLAKSCGLRCRSLTWNPNYKGIDDWQIALRIRRAQKKEEQKNFKERFRTDACSAEQVNEFVQQWEDLPEPKVSLASFLGVNEREFAAFQESIAAFSSLLEREKVKRRFRIYQLDLSAGQVVPFAFKGIKALAEAAYAQPPARSYCLVHDGEINTFASDTDDMILERIAERYSDDLPNGYCGRSVAPSDVLELYDEGSRRYFYVDQDRTYLPVRFSPAAIRRTVTEEENTREWR